LWNSWLKKGKELQYFIFYASFCCWIRDHNTAVSKKYKRKIEKLWRIKGQTWVVFPAPVSARSITVWFFETSSRNRFLAGKMGSRRRDCRRWLSPFWPGESNKQNLITSGQKTRYADLYTESINVLLYGIRIFFQEYDSVMPMPNTYYHKQYLQVCKIQRFYSETAKIRQTED
jgi:hypothetical protein